MAEPAVYCALLHYPVRDRAGESVTTAVTTLDVHDLARSARTYGLRGYFVVTPIEAQHALVERMLSHWSEGAGLRRMPERGEALALVRPLTTLEAAIEEVQAREGAAPRLLATAARSDLDVPTCSFAEARRLCAEPGQPTLVLFGTGHGLADEVLRQADRLIEPIAGPSAYNHLSVRAAAAIVIDRLRGRDI